MSPPSTINHHPSTRLLPLALALLLAACEVTESGGIRFGSPPTPTAAPKAAAPTAAPTAAAKPAESSATPAAAAKPSAGAGPVTGRLPDVASVADRVRPAVAFIAVRTGAGRGPAGAQPSQGVGSGAIFDPRGYIVTNNHVVEGSQQIKVVLPDGRDFDAKLVGRDADSDLAVIKIDGQNLPVAQLGDSDKLRVGEWVVAIGNALGLEGGPTVTAGVVSAVKRTVELPSSAGSIEDAIQTDTAINPGNSGGPLINLNGEIVGINTLVAGQVSPDYQAQGIGFAIAINNAKPIINALISGGQIERPWLGVSAMTLTPAIAQQTGLPFVEGVILSEALANSPAARAGLRQGDVITAMDGQPIKTTEELRTALTRKKVGDRVELTIRRGGQEQKITVVLGARAAG
ncbi:MAG TPA: trypsin-like peptidase domain-containing protein [Chloroflexota bacterium]|jgi:S1-C subfamily serine protease